MSDRMTGGNAALTKNQQNLRLIDLKIRGLRANQPDSPEVGRMNAAREDVMGQMSADERAAYEKLVNQQKSREELEAEAEAERLAMDANRDKPAI
ncbi:MAG: hypothetical protein ACK4SZ_16210 [Allosphingosinicella sp.]|uniref:hypothetical protein n=1 Tax=Allosphingosinicella sp. TaxID=2823234 RepID=UPI00394A685B